jgi:hypothetical protein
VAAVTEMGARRQADDGLVQRRDRKFTHLGPLALTSFPWRIEILALLALNPDGLDLGELPHACTVTARSARER